MQLRTKNIALVLHLLPSLPSPYSQLRFSKEMSHSLSLFSHLCLTSFVYLSQTSSPPASSNFFISSPSYLLSAILLNPYFPDLKAAFIMIALSFYPEMHHLPTWPLSLS
jgi:hypothetical protein